MKFRVIAVGKPRDAHLAEAIRDYEARAARYWPLEFTEVKQELGRGEAVGVKEREGARILERCGAATVVACHESGQSYESRAFATWVQECRERGQDVAFVLGGAFGLHASVLERSVRHLSLAPWTLPHELARLVLAEQLYRAGTILKREPYHK